MDKGSEAEQHVLITPVMRWTLYIAAAVVILAGLYAASDIVGATILALVVVLAVLPVQNWLVSKRVPPVIAFALTLTSVFLVLGALFAVIGIGLAQFAATLPEYEARINEIVAQANQALAAAGINVDALTASMSGDAAVKVAQAAAGWIASAASGAVLAITLGAFMLFDALTFNQKVDYLAGPGGSDRVIGFVADVQQWVTITGVVNAIVAVFNTVFLYLMGIPFALLWGVLSFILGFIPNIGFLLSLVAPAVLALVLYGPTKAIAVIIVFIVINGAVQNIVTPKMMGEGLDLSPFFVIFSLVFWSFLLGPLGGLMAIPLTLVLRLALMSSPDTASVAVLLGGGRDLRARDDSSLRESD